MSASINRIFAFSDTSKQRRSRPDRDMTRRDFADLGGDSLAYIRRVRAQDVMSFCPEASGLAPDKDVHVLCAADGTPILVTDTREAAIANAIDEKLEAVSLH